MIGQYCRKYRKEKNITLKELGGEKQIKNLSAFEFNRSSNAKHLMLYIVLSSELNDSDNFISGLIRSQKEG